MDFVMRLAWSWFELGVLEGLGGFCGVVGSMWVLVECRWVVGGWGDIVFVMGCVGWCLFMGVVWGWVDWFGWLMVSGLWGVWVGLCWFSVLGWVLVCVCGIGMFVRGWASLFWCGELECGWRYYCGGFGCFGVGWFVF